MRKITNLTNSPFDLHGESGVVRLPAHESVVGNFSGDYLVLLAMSDAVKIEDSFAEDKSLADEYEELAGKPADKRWSDARLADEISKLKKDT